MSRLLMVCLWSAPFLWFVVESDAVRMIAGVR